MFSHSMRFLRFLAILFGGVFCQRWYLPPPKVLLSNHPDCVSGNDPEIDDQTNCHGGTFNLSMGFYIPCRAHKHCYGAREPPSWCVSDYNWTQWGCHCDPKIGSCIVERFQKLGENLEWAYCIPSTEFFCEASLSPSKHPKRTGSHKLNK